MKLRLWNPNYLAEVEFPPEFEVETIQELPIPQPSILVVPAQFACSYAYASLALADRTGEIPQYAVMYGTPVRVDRRVYDDVVRVGDWEALRDAIACDRIRLTESLAMVSEFERYGRLVLNGCLENSPENFRAMLGFAVNVIDDETRGAIEHALGCEACFHRLREKVPQIVEMERVLSYI